MKLNKRKIPLKRLIIYPATLLAFVYVAVTIYSNPKAKALPVDSLDASLVESYTALIQDWDGVEGNPRINRDVIQKINLELDLSINDKSWQQGRSAEYKDLFMVNGYLECIIITSQTDSFLNNKTYTGFARYKKVLNNDRFIVPFETNEKNGHYVETKLGQFSENPVSHMKTILYANIGACKSNTQEKTTLLNLGRV